MGIGEQTSIPPLADMPDPPPPLPSAKSPPPTPTAITMTPSRAELEVLTEMANAQIAARVELPPGCKTPQAILMKFLLGRELGLSPMVSLHELDIIEGRGSMNARTQVAMIRRRGLGDVRLVQQTDTSATVKAWRADDPDTIHEFTYTLKDAERAKLLTRKTWQKYPKSMLLARAISLATHALFQEVFLGVACTPDELGADTDEHGRLEFIDVSATTGISVKPSSEMTLSETVETLGKSQAEITEVVPPPTPSTPQEQPEDSKARGYHTTVVKSLATSLGLSPEAWEKIRAQHGGLKGSKMTLEQVVSLRKHLQSLAMLDLFRESLSIPPGDWLQALGRRGATVLHNLNAAAAAAFEEKLSAKFAPFDLAKLKNQLVVRAGSVRDKPTASTAGNVSPPATLPAS